MGYLGDLYDSWDSCTIDDSYSSCQTKRRDDMIIDLKTNKKVEVNKEKEWIALGKTYRADTLEILEKDDEFPDDRIVFANHGYHLTWHTKEDDIHVYGDGAKKISNAIIKVDEATYRKESIDKLQCAVDCAKEINANKKKFF